MINKVYLTDCIHIANREVFDKQEIQKHIYEQGEL